MLNELYSWRLTKEQREHALPLQTLHCSPTLRPLRPYPHLPRLESPSPSSFHPSTLRGVRAKQNECVCPFFSTASEWNRSGDTAVPTEINWLAEKKSTYTCADRTLRQDLVSAAAVILLSSRYLHRPFVTIHHHHVRTSMSHRLLQRGRENTPYFNTALPVPGRHLALEPTYRVFAP